MKKILIYLLPLLIIFLIIACEKNNELYLEKEKDSSENIVNDFFTIDEKLYNQLCENKLFLDLSKNYSLLKWKVILEELEDKMRLDSVVKQIYLLGEKYDCKNALAYSIFYEANITGLSRASHEWGACAICPPTTVSVCNTQRYWQNAWLMCGEYEARAAMELGHDKFDLNKYRYTQHDFFARPHRVVFPDGKMMNITCIYGWLYRKLAIVEDMHPQVSLYPFAINLSLNSIVSNVSVNVEYDDYICLYIAGMEMAFMDFYYSNVWKNCILSEDHGGNTPNPDENTQKPGEDLDKPTNPSEGLPWNKTTHYKILDFVASKVGFTEEELSELKGALLGRESVFFKGVFTCDEYKLGYSSG